MNPPIFWDIVGPIALFFLGISLILSIYFFFKKRIGFIFICSIVTGTVSFITAWSIGSYVLILSILQLLAAIYLFVKNKISA